MPNVPIPSCLPVLVGAATILGLFLYLFISLKIELWRFKNKTTRETAKLQHTCTVLREEIGGMHDILKEAEARSAVLVPPRTSRSGMNVNKRIQAMRMSKRGERPEQIAAALGLPRNEVALLLKVQRMTLEG